MRLGVCIVALGYEIYGSYALNLAASLKVYDPDIDITLLYEPSAISHLTDQELGLFNQKVLIPESEYTINGIKQYQRVKLLINKYAPYEYTMYMDADNIWFDKKVSWLFGELISKDFYIGYNGEYDVSKKNSKKTNYPFWGDPKKICEYFGIKTHLPQTVSGFFYFRKCDKADEIFAKALEVYDDENAPCIKWADGKADEYCFNVALAKLNYTQKEFHVFYFDKLNKILEPNEIYKGFWGMATGGSRVKDFIVILYNKLVNKYCMILGIPTRHYHIDKAKVISSRKAF